MKSDAWLQRHVGKVVRVNSGLALKLLGFTDQHVVFDIAINGNRGGAKRGMDG